MLHVIVTGPESTGKTTLSRRLAEHLGGVWVPEYPRGYLEAAGRRAVAGDFRHFAAADRQLLAAAQATGRRRGAGGPLVVQDTGAEVLAMWYADKFGPVPTYLAEALRAHRPDVYLACRPDLPWTYDPLREDPHRRDKLFAELRRTVDCQGCRIVEVTGFGESRLAGALAAVERLRTKS